MREMVDGWTGKRLRVNLSDGAVTVEEIDESYRKKWLGGRASTPSCSTERLDLKSIPWGPTTG